MRLSLYGAQKFIMFGIIQVDAEPVDLPVALFAEYHKVIEIN